MERLRHTWSESLYFTANEVAADKRVTVLLSSIGAATYSLLSDLVAPHSPRTKSLKEISAALRNHYEPKRVVISERFHFHKRDQAAGETIANYDAALCKLATIANSELHSKTPSETDLFVASATRLFSADFCQKQISLTIRQWRSHKRWRPPMPTPTRSRSRQLPTPPFGSFLVNLLRTGK